jgi:hypothetical protein
MLLLAGAAPSQAPKPFSHRNHLKLVPACTSCHGAVPRSAAVEDDNLPRKEVCLPCHQDVSIKRPAETTVSRFSHALHAKLGNVAPLIAAAIDRKTYLSGPSGIRRHLDTKDPCAACHRGLEESDRVTSAAFPQMADCLVCHTAIDPPFSCEKCHAETAKLKPASHTSGYIDFHSSGKANLDKASCAVCHGRKFTCMGCH